jgi:hypothetical protein
MKQRTVGRGGPAVWAALAGLALGAAPVWAQGDRATRYVPANTVVRVKLAEKLSSRTARQGDTIRAVLHPEDRSGFPEGTEFEGTVTEVQKAGKDKPGGLNVKIRRAVMPDGRLVAATGFLASLEDDDVRRTEDGRLEARERKSGSGKMEWKWVGYGAAGGAVLSTVVGGGFLKGALLGGLGGAVYSYLNKSKGKGEYRDVELAEGSEFGIRMYEQVAFADNPMFRYADYEPDPDPDEREERRNRDRRDRDREERR